ncbi:MAG TPA: alpha/beta hydrolase [Flavisolibacter sp.]|nr:alpha/beta hydrolase [Flavisolibacter sp.]
MGRANANDSLYKEVPVMLHTQTGDIFGTLTLPAQKTMMPVALIIAGSGPTDRNGNNPMMKNESLHKLALALADSGIASLRYDKRAIAESKAAAKSENDLRFDDYVNDAKDWIGLLRKDKRFSKVIVIGHSEGSLIGMIAANNNADAYVSIAGAGRPADKILKEQLDKQPQAVKDLSFPIIDSLVMGKTVSNVNPMLFSLFRPSVQPYMISWFRYDPSVEMHKLSIPVLVIQGTNDIQVSLEDALLLAKANSKAQLVEVNNMNHIFRIVEGDRNANIATYNDASLPIATELINSIVSFIRKLKQ